MMGRAVSGLITGTGLRPAPWTLHWALEAARRASEFPNQRRCAAMQKLHLLSATLGLLAVASFPAEYQAADRLPALVPRQHHDRRQREPAVCGSRRDA